METSRTPNQIVAFNLKRARTDRGWSLDRTAQELEPFVGQRWSRQNLNALERTLASGKLRRFDADDIVAFARVFEVPVAWFFIPPPYIDTVATAGEDLGAGELIDLLFNRGWERIRERLLEIPEEQYGRDLEALAETIDLYMVEYLSDIPGLEVQLRDIADRLANARLFAGGRDRAERRATGEPFLRNEEGRPLPTLPRTKSRASSTDDV